MGLYICSPCSSALGRFTARLRGWCMPCARGLSILCICGSVAPAVVSSQRPPQCQSVTVQQSSLSWLCNPASLGVASAPVKVAAAPRKSAASPACPATQHVAQIHEVPGTNLQGSDAASTRTAQALVFITVFYGFWQVSHTHVGLSGAGCISHLQAAQLAPAEQSLSRANSKWIAAACKPLGHQRQKATQLGT